MAQDAIAARAEIAELRFQLARYRRAEFGRSSEKLAREIEQLELSIETLETDQAERIAAASPVVAAAIESAVEAKKPARRPLPEHLPRDLTRAVQLPDLRRRVAPDRRGNHRDARLVPGRFKVIQHVRESSSAGPATPSLRRRRPIT
jgi:transposase